MGAHQGEGPLNEYINSIAAFRQNAVSVLPETKAQQDTII